MMRIGCVALALAVAPGAFAQTPQGGACHDGAVAYSAGRYAGALTDLKTCIADKKLTEFDRALGYTYLLQTLEKMDRIDELGEHLRTITSPPWSEMDAFTPATLAMQKMRESEIFVGYSQPRLINNLAVVLLHQGKTDEALVEIKRAINLARTMRADVLADEAEAWMTYAGIMQEKGDQQGMLAGMVRAYVRGADHPELKEYVSQQSPEAQVKLAEMRKTMMEHRPAFAYRDAWALSLGKRLDLESDPDAGAALMKFGQVEAEEASLVGAIPF